MIHRSGNLSRESQHRPQPMRLNSWAKILYRSMSKFDIPITSAKNQTMNVSLPEQMEEFVRQKVAAGDYETASEVVREGLRLLKQRDDLWKAEVRSKIKQGMDSIRAGRSIPAQQVKVQMAAFKKKWKKNRSLK
jgi:antitoxin ParD1/3/4